jgi:hypothetical protein
VATSFIIAGNALQAAIAIKARGSVPIGGTTISEAAARAAVVVRCRGGVCSEWLYTCFQVAFLLVCLAAVAGFAQLLALEERLGASALCFMVIMINMLQQTAAG